MAPSTAPVDPYTGGLEPPATPYPPATYPAPQPPGPYTAPAATYGVSQPYGYGYVDPNAPYGYDPLSGQPLSDKSRLAAGLLQLLLGFFFTLGGVGRLYAGHTNIGVVQIVVSVVAWISFWCGFFLFVPFIIWFGAWLWFIIDGIVLLAQGGLDRNGRVLR